MEPNAAPQPASPDRFLPVSILVAAVMVSATLIYTTRTNTGGTAPREKSGATGGTGAAAAEDVSKLRSRDVILGEENAPVTLVEYGDYQCPFCEKFFREAEPLIREHYVKTGKVRMIYRDFAFLGTESTASAEAAGCAKDQGKFWPFHDALFVAEGKDAKENNGNLNRALFFSIARDLALDEAKFTSCFDAAAYASDIAASRDDAAKLGVNGTPSVFVNGAFLNGARPYADYAQAIDRALAGAKQ